MESSITAHKYYRYTVKNRLAIFPSPAEMSLTRLSLGGNNGVIYKLFPPRESLVNYIPAGEGNIEKLFLRCKNAIPLAESLRYSPLQSVIFTAIDIAAVR